ncbi:MAG: hypothetical protein NC094_12145 [Bacteroidales bacterium]|nr:hypothetical protein [Lachnoclostridium sp.]MCM1385254.1 hypothetical protein [Lachnoclostridium sp.]MCM1466160.1 hypothetical protein [Bacteroidales bacterium]
MRVQNIEQMEKVVTTGSITLNEVDVELLAVVHKSGVSVIKDKVHYMCDETDILNVSAIPIEELRIFEVYSKVGESYLQTNVCGFPVDINPVVDVIAARELKGYNKQEAYNRLCTSTDFEKVKILKVMLRKAIKEKGEDD